MKKISIVLLAICLFFGCEATPLPHGTFTLPPEALAVRQLQTRRFETTNYEAMLNAASAVFQDLGFTLDEAEYKLGILVGSKTRDATSAGQVSGYVALSVLAALVGAPVPSSDMVDKSQTIHAFMAMREIDANVEGGEKANESTSSTVRVTFHRIIISQNNNETKYEQINDPDIYREFFDKLSQAIFLEAYEL